MSAPGQDDWMNPGVMVGERVKFAKSFHPTIARLVGDSVLRAAARYDLGCRWHLALADARVSRGPAPVYDAVHRELLGEPCDRCKTALRTAEDQRKGVMAALVASVNAGRQSTGRRPPRGHKLAASGWAGPTSHDPMRTCFCSKQLTADGRPVQVPPHPWFGSLKAYHAWVRAGRPRKGR